MWPVGRLHVVRGKASSPSSGLSLEAVLLEEGLGYVLVPGGRRLGGRVEDRWLLVAVRHLYALCSGTGGRRHFVDRGMAALSGDVGVASYQPQCARAQFEFTAQRFREMIQALTLSTLFQR